MTSETGGDLPGPDRIDGRERSAARDTRILKGERSAEYLRDDVIQRIFAVALGLTTLAARLEEPTVALRLSAYVEELDKAISAIYLAIGDFVGTGSSE